MFDNTLLPLEQQYQRVLYEITRKGEWTFNRTGVDTQFIPSAILQHDMADGFPLMGLRQLFWKGGTAEAQGFLRGLDDASEFEKLGCRFWTANANEPSKGSTTSDWLSSPYRRGVNHLGDIYGVQWRAWIGGNGVLIDQIHRALKLIKERPTDRRIVVTAWNPDAVVNTRAALPPCHDSFVITLGVKSRKMHLSWRQRSTDFILGTPTNLVSYAFILETLARLTGYIPGTLTGHLDNVHIYENHTHAVDRLLDRKSLGLPQLTFAKEVPIGLELIEDQLSWLEKIDNSMLNMVNYKHHDKIENLEMAV